MHQLTGQVLADVVQRKGATAGSLDGWSWRELKVLPVSWYDELARILSKVEDLGVWLDGLLDAYITMIPKTDGDSTSLGQRPLSVLPVVYRIWAFFGYLSLSSVQVVVAVQPRPSIPLRLTLRKFLLVLPILMSTSLLLMLSNPSTLLIGAFWIGGKGISSIWAPASQDSPHVGNAGVGVVSLRGAPLALPIFATGQFKSFFDCGRAVRCLLPLSSGRFLHLFVLCGCQGADADAEQLALTDHLFDAALGELHAVAAGQPCLLVGDFNVGPPKSLAWQKGFRLGSGLILGRLGLLLLVCVLLLLVSVVGLRLVVIVGILFLVVLLLLLLFFLARFSRIGGLLLT